MTNCFFLKALAQALALGTGPCPAPGPGPGPGFDMSECNWWRGGINKRLAWRAESGRETQHQIPPPQPHALTHHPTPTQVRQAPTPPPLSPHTRQSVPALDNTVHSQGCSGLE